MVSTKHGQWITALRCACAVAVFLGPGTGHVSGQKAPRACATPTAERLTRTGENLARNPGLNDTKGWQLSGGALYDPNMSHVTGSGAIDLAGHSAAALSDQIPIRSGVRYTIGAYVRTDPWPVLMFLTADLLNSSGKRTGIVQASAQATTGPGRWEEVVASFTPQPGDVAARIRIGRYPANPKPGSTFERGRLWVDDFYFGEGLGFNDPPTAKRAFQGQLVAVDDLGNFTIMNAGKPEAYFPLCIYGTPDRFKLYSQQGFNCVARNAFSPGMIQQARDATSSFNPGGMLSNVEITHYMVPALAQYGDTLTFTRTLTALEHSPQRASVLAFYWDDEQYDEYLVPKAITDIVKSLDVDSAGHRLHPIFALEGSQGRARAQGTLADIVGDYLRPPVVRSVVQQSTAERFAILRHLNGQIAPAPIGIISQKNSAGMLRRLVYEGLIAGVRGFFYFKDGACDGDFDGDSSGPGCKDITQRPAWKVIPALRAELDTLKPVLREPVGTEWTAHATPAQVSTGTRNHACDGYVFVVNTDSSAVEAHVAIAGLPYTAQRAEEVLIGTTQTVSNGGFTVQLPAWGTAVYRLRR